MTDVRPATDDDLRLIARIAAAGFFADPVMSWALPDDNTRRTTLQKMFWGLAVDMQAPRGVVWLNGQACVSLWRDPSFDHEGEADAEEARRTGADVEEDEDPLFTPEEAARMEILGAAMRLAHPHEPHWYLNLVSTLPTHQGRGLGAAVLQPGLAQADASGLPCYLESTNPRNRSLYRRLGFEDRDELPLDGGPSMLAMWRPARS